jgi:hypothetical protein
MKLAVVITKEIRNEANMVNRKFIMGAVKKG